MKAQISKILTLGFSLIFSFAAAGYLKCIKCSNVNKDNTCSGIETSCESDGYCYTQRLYKGGKIENVSRGCTEICKHIINYKKKQTKLQFCCEKDNCNLYNSWL